MSETAMWCVLVPCNYNDGRPVRTRHHREWDKRVRRITGGLTILPPAKGQWEHEGTLYRDRVIPVYVIATEEQMRRIAKITMEHYNQLAVMVFKVSSETHLICRE